MINTMKRSGNNRLSLNSQNTLVGLSFILPNFLGFAFFILVPVIFSFGLSFARWDGFSPMAFVGLKNFVEIFQDRVFKTALMNTVNYAVFTVVLTMVASLALAILLNRKMAGVNFFRSAVFFPYVASIVAVGAVWNALFMKEAGPINAFLRALGLSNPPGWFGSVQWAMPAVVIVSIWKSMGYFMIVYLAALQGVPDTLYEAAEMDGASKWKQFLKITVPMLAPAHFFVCMMLTVNSFKIFDLIFVLTDGGGPGTATKMLANVIYDRAFLDWKYGLASAVSMVLFLIVGSITVLQFRIEKKFNDFL